MQAESTRLPVAKVIAGALMLAWERRYALLHALWLPLLFGMVFTVSETLWGPSSWELEPPGQQTSRQGSLLLWTLPLFVLTVVFAVRSYRVYLLGDELMRAIPAFSWSLRETRFVFAMAGIAFLFALAAVTFGSIVGALWPGASDFANSRFGLVLMLPPGYLAGRLLLAFPAIAIDDSIDVLQALGNSWAISKQNGLRLLVLCVLAPGAIAWSLGALSTLGIPGGALLSSIAVWLVMPVELAIVALSYETLKREGAASTADSEK
jgi:hypothetical protein